MTFKHGNFGDFVVMRSLEKLAQEKGLVSPEKAIKTASTKVGLTPSNNFTSNILNLCAGLRASNFHKQADELESKFMIYKKSQTLYEAFKETGEDLVDLAHPKGSHKLEGVDGGDLTVIETIVDQHLKTLKMIDKMPTGKLASSRDILNAVKIVLGQTIAEQLDPLRKENAITELSYILGHLDQAKEILNKIDATSLKWSFNIHHKDIVIRINNATKDNVNIQEINKIIGGLNSIQDSINGFKWGDLLVGGLSVNLGNIYDAAKGNFASDLRSRMTTHIDESLRAANRAKASILGQNDENIKLKTPFIDRETVEKQTLEQTNKYLQEQKAIHEKYSGIVSEGNLNILKAKFEKLKNILNTGGYTDIDKMQGNKIVDPLIAKLNNMISVLSQLNDSEDSQMKKDVLAKYQPEYYILIDKANQFAAGLTK